MKEAMLYEKLGEGKVRCNLCNHRCLIFPQKKGICQVRQNYNGTLYSLVYERLISKAIDPIEKKPLFHFHPGSSSYSIATIGCNFHCPHCQNHDISQYPQEHQEIIGHKITPEEIANDALGYGCKSISYTYVEPTVFFEYAYEVARLAHQLGIKNVFVSNGYLTEEAIRILAPYLDGINVDLKAFSDGFYRRLGAKLQPVLDSIKLLKELDVWVEVTTLIIPTLNDSEEELREIALFIKDVDEGIPWHVTRFHPSYKLKDLPSTPPETLQRARRVGLGVGLRYVYEGNVLSEEGENTYCYSCGELLIKRFYFQVLEYKIQDGRCPYCKAKIDGVW
jgi:pyruvate formate lyase activating enzyme